MPATMGDGDHRDVLLQHNEIDHVRKPAKPDPPDVIDRDRKLNWRLFNGAEGDAHGTEEFMPEAIASLLVSAKRLRDVSARRLPNEQAPASSTALGDLVHDLLPGLAQVAVRGEFSATASNQLPFLRGGRDRLWLEAVPQLLREFDSLRRAQMAEVEDAYSHTGICCLATGQSNRPID